jgi:hypothetical protein
MSAELFPKSMHITEAIADLYELLFLSPLIFYFLPTDC